MTAEQLDRFQDWLNREAVEANKKSGAYFNGRACAFNDAFECLTILRMNDSQPPESTDSDKSLHVTKDGSPGHPLYLKGDSTPFPLTAEVSHGDSEKRS